MSDFSAITRQRAALTTIADAIVAASVGRDLQVIMDCPNTHLALVDRLAQALHARGRACHCLPTQSPQEDAGDLAATRQEHDSTVVVITSGSVTESHHPVQRVSISVTAAATGTPDDTVDQEGRDNRAGESAQPDIVLDYRDPDGPRIRHLAPRLTADDRP
ncbi:hypothetical protein ACFO0M_19660 [Micromonospora mangrovi]|uniref:Helicase C-terminal domain-containing protein n=2 Tax=Micromonospora TaxID=1873 RepID=A0AAU8H870_9ACTN